MIAFMNYLATYTEEYYNLIVKGRSALPEINIIFAMCC